MTLQTILALFLILQNLFTFPITRKLYTPTRLLLFILITIILSGLWGGNFNSVYLNFIFWIINAIAFLKTLNVPYFKDLAIKVWAYTILVFTFYIFLTLLGFPRLPFLSHLKNAIGIIFSVFLPVAVVYFRFKWKLNYFWFLMLFLIIVLFLNASRSSILAFSISSVLLIYTIEIQYFKKYKYFVLLPFSFALFLILLPLLRANSSKLDERISDIEQVFSSEYDIRDVEASSFSIRFLVMEKALHLFKENPIHGVGLYNFQQYHGTKFDYFFRYIRKKERNLNAHNSYLSMLSETGLLGFIPFSLFIMSIIVRIIKSFTYQNRKPNLYNLIGAGMAIGVLIEMFFVYNIISIATWTYLAAIFPLTNSASIAIK